MIRSIYHFALFFESNSERSRSKWRYLMPPLFASCYSHSRSRCCILPVRRSQRNRLPVKQNREMDQKAVRPMWSHRPWRTVLMTHSARLCPTTPESTPTNYLTSFSGSYPERTTYLRPGKLRNRGTSPFSAGMT